MVISPNFLSKSSVGNPAARNSRYAPTNETSPFPPLPKRGFTAWLCESPDGGLPDHATRLKLDRTLTQISFEHLIVFVTAGRDRQSWMWVRRESAKPLCKPLSVYRGKITGIEYCKGLCGNDYSHFGSLFWSHAPATQSFCAN
jgi:hypothetical protein